MLPGYNHNVKYKDKVYHVQTEDSGVENPHIITHLFFGGNIISSVKKSYADIVLALNLNELLVEVMQGQHKTVLKDLIRGKYDDDIAVRSVNAATLNGPAPINVEAGAQHRVSLFAGAGEAASRAAASAKAAASAAAAAKAAETPASSFFGSSPPAKVIEASTLEAAFESNDGKAVDSIFGNLISEKSLDEVILSYLADDTKRE